MINNIPMNLVGILKVLKGATIMAYGDDFDEFNDFYGFNTEDFNKEYKDSFQERYDRSNGAPFGTFDFNGDGDLSYAERLVRSEHYYQLEQQEQDAFETDQLDYLLDEDDDYETGAAFSASNVPFDNQPFFGRPTGEQQEDLNEYDINNVPQDEGQEKLRQIIRDWANNLSPEDKRKHRNRMWKLGKSGDPYSEFRKALAHGRPAEAIDEPEKEDIWETMLPVAADDQDKIQDIRQRIQWRFQYMQTNFVGLRFFVRNLETDEDVAQYYNQVFKNGNDLERQCEEILIKAQENSFNFRTNENKREMYGALVVTGLIGSDEAMEKRCRFIMENFQDRYQENLAAKYLSPVDGFLYLQAVTENFGSSNVAPMEQLQSIYMPFQIISERAKTNPYKAVDIWLWLVDNFDDYREYGTKKDTERALKEDVAKGLASGDVLRPVAQAMAGHPEVLENIFWDLDKAKEEEPAVVELARMVDIYVYAKEHGGDQVPDVDFDWTIK